MVYMLGDTWGVLQGGHWVVHGGAVLGGGDLLLVHHASKALRAPKGLVPSPSTLDGEGCANVGDETTSSPTTQGLG